MNTSGEHPSNSRDRGAGSDEPSTASPEVDGQTDSGEPADGSTQDEFFDTAHLSSDLKGRAVRGGAATMVGQLAARGIQIGSTVVLARILTPQDYGLIAMITAVTGFVVVFKDLGLSMATIQRDKITHEQISTLFWVNLALSVLVMLVVMALSPAIAWFYEEPRLLALTLVMAAGFVAGGLTVQHQALLRRQMRFKALSIIEVGKVVVSVVVAIVAALSGAGVWALALMPVAGSIFGGAAVWLICPWRPSRPRRGSGVRSMLAFGGNLTGFNVVNYFSRNLDNLLIGKVWGTASLGLYAKAYELLLLPLQQITSPVAAVAVPTLSRLQHDPERYKQYYLKAVSLIAAVTMPGVLYMILMSHEIIHLILGDQWTGAAKIFAILGVSALIQPVLSTTGWLYISSGRTDRMFRWGIFSSIGIVCSFLIGLPFGAIGVATSYTACMLLLAAPCLWYACQSTALKPTAILAAILNPLLATTVAGVCLAALIQWLPQLATGMHGLALGLAVTSVAYLATSGALVRGYPPVFEIVNVLRKR